MMAKTGQGPDDPRARDTPAEPSTSDPVAILNGPSIDDIDMVAKDSVAIRHIAIRVEGPSGSIWLVRRTRYVGFLGGAFADSTGDTCLTGPPAPSSIDTGACICVAVYVRSMVDTVQRRLTAISEPNRFRIVELLRDGPRSVGGIVLDLGLGQPQVSRHLRLLAEAGVVEATRQAQQRIYRLDPRSMRELSDWTQRFAGLWSERMDRLGSVLAETEQ